jgi:hypothetical protein
MLAPIKQSEPQRSYQSCLGYRAMINILEVMDLQVPPVAGAAHTLGGCSPIVKATDRWSWHHVGSNVASRPVPRAVWSHCEWVGGAQTSVLGHLYLPVAYDFLPLLGVVGHPPPDGGPGALDGVVGGCCTLRPPLYVRFVCLLFPL